MRIFLSLSLLIPAFLLIGCSGGSNKAENYQFIDRTIEQSMEDLPIIDEAGNEFYEITRNKNVIEYRYRLVTPIGSLASDNVIKSMMIPGLRGMSDFKEVIEMKMDFALIYHGVNSKTRRIDIPNIEISGNNK